MSAWGIRSKGLGHPHLCSDASHHIEMESQRFQRTHDKRWFGIKLPVMHNTPTPPSSSGVILRNAQKRERERERERYKSKFCKEEVLQQDSVLNIRKSAGQIGREYWGRNMWRKKRKRRIATRELQTGKISRFSLVFLMKEEKERRRENV